MTMTSPRNSRLIKPAFLPTIIIMGPSFPAVFLLVMVVVVGLSDCASVPITDNLESLAASKILRDHTSTPTGTELRTTTRFLERNVKSGEDVVVTTSKQEFVNEDIPQISSTPPVLYTSPNRDDFEMSSPLHVARCRASCLEKFGSGNANKNRHSLPSSSRTSEDANTSADEMHLLPILRLRKRRSPGVNNFVNSKSSWSCFHHSPDCFTCWKSCELLEPGRNTKEVPFPVEGGKVNEPTEESLRAEIKKKQGKQSILACSSLDPQCTLGCQVACSFYERLLTKNGKNEGQHWEGASKAFTSDPVVATKQESVVRIVPGKITWPSWSNSGNKETPLSSSTLQDDSPARVVPVVYVVIQEYPDRKWRQIAQTTEAEVEIPRELTSAMKTKLRSVRVLLVGPSGLLSVYSPERPGKQEQLSDNNNNSGKVVVVEGKSTTPGGETEIVEASSGNDGNTTPESEQEIREDGPGATVILSDSISSTNTNDHLEGDIALTTLSTPSSRGDSPATSFTNGDNQEGGLDEPFGLRRVSLIHQKSLVIAELRWRPIGSNPSQEYLITWELTGGGLKGHLVTDSTSVTLSLWPDTMYRIQVELFEENLDGDGEQPAESSPVSLKSLPLTVDTSEASFPMESPSALLSGDEDQDEEEDSIQEGNERGDEEEPAHKSITGFRNMTLVLGISAAALVFVLAILTVAAFTWARMRAKSQLITPSKSMKVGCQRGGCCCYRGCFSYRSREPQLLLEQDDLLDDSSTSFPPGFRVGMNSQRKKKSNRNLIPVSFGTSHSPTKKAGQEGPSSVPITVAVISRSSSGSNPSLNYPNEQVSSAGKVVGAVGVIKVGGQGSPSSSRWLPNATCTTITNDVATSSPVTTTSTRTTRLGSSIQQQGEQQQQYLHQLINNRSSSGNTGFY